MIPTAEEFFYELYPDAHTEHCDISKVMIDFAKLHVTEALKIADNHAKMFEETKNIRNSILNAYHSENIK